MSRDECWMTFSEALESYLDAREARGSFGPGHNRTQCETDMETAKQHMDALTKKETKQ